MYCKVSLPNIIQAIDDGLVLIMATLFRKKLLWIWISSKIGRYNY